jgi:hypothetical protein
MALSFTTRGGLRSPQVLSASLLFEIKKAISWEACHFLQKMLGDSGYFMRLLSLPTWAQFLTFPHVMATAISFI